MFNVINGQAVAHQSEVEASPDAAEVGPLTKKARKNMADIKALQREILTARKEQKDYLANKAELAAKGIHFYF